MPISRTNFIGARPGRPLSEIGQGDAALSEAIEALLGWRDNNWQEMEDLLVKMLAQRDRWMHDFVLSAKPELDPDWSELRERLERPFAKAVQEGLSGVDHLLNQVSRRVRRGARAGAIRLRAG